MKRMREGFAERHGIAVIASLILASWFGSAIAQTKTYVYDDAGRLRQVVTSGAITTYVLDAAGNRTVVNVDVTPGVPASITVPSSNTTGSYSVSWGASSGTPTRYELYESTSSGFSPATQVYSGTATNASISGKGNGTYYYRVRACTGVACSDYRVGSNSTTVTLPPSAPSSITVPTSSNTGNYTISWGTATGNVTSYELYEATNSSFTGQVQVYAGTATSHSPSGRANGTYYYQVRACNGTVCGAYRTGSNAITVTLPLGVPASITIPASSNTGSYSVSWGSVSGAVTAYELYESTNSSFSPQTLVYNAAGTSTSFSGKANGAYYYRVRACNGSNCGDYRTGSNGIAVAVPPTTPTGLTATAVSATQINLSWSASTAWPGSTLSGYRIFRGGSQIATTAATTFSDTTVASSTTYSYTVAAYDSASNQSAQSAPASATTPFTWIPIASLGNGPVALPAHASVYECGETPEWWWCRLRSSGAYVYSADFSIWLATGYRINQSTFNLEVQSNLYGVTP